MEAPAYAPFAQRVIISLCLGSRRVQCVKWASSRQEGAQCVRQRATQGFTSPGLRRVIVALPEDIQDPLARHPARLAVRVIMRQKGCRVA